MHSTIPSLTGQFNFLVLQSLMAEERLKALYILILPPSSNFFSEIISITYFQSYGVNDRIWWIWISLSRPLACPDNFLSNWSAYISEIHICILLFVSSTWPLYNWPLWLFEQQAPRFLCTDINYMYFILNTYRLDILITYIINDWWCHEWLGLDFSN